MDYFLFTQSVLRAPLDHFTNPSSRAFLLYLATSLLVALYIHRKEARLHRDAQGPLGAIFPGQVYTHRSAVVDYIYFITNTMLYAFILAPFAGLGVAISQWTQRGLGVFFTQHVMTDLSPMWATVGFSILVALLADFGTFYAHYWIHRIPVLWEFHKVHHSAEVMTPITVFRMHPLDDVITLFVVGTLTGVSDAAIRFFITPNVSPYGMYGIGVASFLFFLSGYHLRHSHIWLSYGPTLSRLFISPAQHQIHHSKAKQHWDKNYGFILAIWDWMFGSLYVPKEREQIEFGIGNGEEHLYSSPLKLYVLPFKKALAIIRRK
jgi:sterol desaturase/sphingolipid hydroxylase (fatty acid hydroxylase superfamily)